MDDQIQTVVTNVTGTIHAKFGPASRNYFAARRSVAKLHQHGSLNEEKLFEFAYPIRLVAEGFHGTPKDIHLLIERNSFCC
jgi:hypothetical protein